MSLSNSHKGFSIEFDKEKLFLFNLGGECVMSSSPIEFTTESMNKIKDAAMQFKNSVSTFFKEHDVEIKDWKFGVESTNGNQIIDVGVKILVKPKKR